MHLEDVIVSPIVTEKASILSEELGAFSFWVDLRANKYQIKRAVEALYDVKVLRLKTMVYPGKLKRAGRHVFKTSKKKKAVVFLGEGQKIEFFKGA